MCGVGKECNLFHKPLCRYLGLENAVHADLHISRQNNEKHSLFGDFYETRTFRNLNVCVTHLMILLKCSSQSWHGVRFCISKKKIRFLI